MASDERVATVREATSIKNLAINDMAGNMGTAAQRAREPPEFISSVDLDRLIEEVAVDEAHLIRRNGQES